jgi:superfamily II DNA or RNA helicase
LIVFDEADRFILHDTEKFASLINNCFCICLTATPDDGDSKGPQRVVVDTLQFSRYNYVTDSPKFQKIKLEVDEVVVAVQT